MNVVKLVRGDIAENTELPWPIFDANDYMLYKAGHIFDSADEVEKIIQRGVYRERTLEDENFLETDQEHFSDSFNRFRSPFSLVNDFASRLGHILSQIEDGNQVGRERILKLAEDIIWLCEHDMDAALAIIHLPSNHKRYSIYHPVHIAMLSSLLAIRMNINGENRLSMIAASLTANIGMRNFQEVLQRQCIPITEKQRKRIQNHPLKSARLLRKIGILDEVWLKVVEQHHEQSNGKGYPNGLSGSEILLESSIVSIADVYSAMMSKRADRKAINVQDALREFFTEKGGAYSETLSLTLIKELGIYPPGTFVRLANDDIGIVVKRLIGRSNNPIVKSVQNAEGEKYTASPVRDTGFKKYQIMESIFYQLPEDYNLGIIWGYSKK